VDAAILTLRDDLNDTIDAINATNNDFALDRVDDEAYFPGGLAGEATMYPFVEVSASDEIVSIPAIEQAAWSSDCTLIVCVWLRHVHDETLYRSQLRYGQAVMSVLAQKGAFGAELWTNSMRAAYRRNPETETTEQLIGAALVVSSITGDEP